jgi:hypothetical protein
VGKRWDRDSLQENCFASKWTPSSRDFEGLGAPFQSMHYFAGRDHVGERAVQSHWEWISQDCCCLSGELQVMKDPLFRTVSYQ